MLPRGLGAQRSSRPSGSASSSARAAPSPRTGARRKGTLRAPTTDFTLSPILEPLAPFKNDIVVLRGVNMESSNARYGPIANVHDQGMTHMLTADRPGQGAGRARGGPTTSSTGRPGGPSIDQHIAPAIGGATLLPSLELGVESTDTFLETLVTKMCYGPVDPNDEFKRAIPSSPSTIRCRSTPG